MADDKPMERNRKLASELLACAKEAGNAIAGIKSAKRAHKFKPHHELVTDADQLSHELLYRSLSERFPGVALVMEEQESDAAIPSTCIVVDELDGTAVYAYGGVDWGVTCALIENGRPTSAVIYLPDRHTAVIASTGGGAWINNRRVVLPTRIPINKAMLFAEINRFMDVDDLEYIKQLANLTLGVRALACSTASITEMLLGRGHLYLNACGGKIWDFAAGALAMEEAGGIVRSVDGGAIDWQRRELGVMMFACESLVSDVALLQRRP